MPLYHTVKPQMRPGQYAPVLLCYRAPDPYAVGIWASILILLFCLTYWVGPARASTANICDTAAHRIARESNVPVSVLLSITRTETGRTQGGALEPWPWTVNMEGKGKWFETEDAARAFVFKHFKTGARSFDVGCFQINYKWHGAAFQSIDQMFDPIENARYAAGFLKELYDETGDWSKAAGAYHSRTPEYARRYTARFNRIRQKFTDQTEPAPPLPTPDIHLATAPVDRVRVNRYPLLQVADTKGIYGSLVPLTQTGGRALFQNAQPIAGVD
jgi:hypothetical protein